MTTLGTLRANVRLLADVDTTDVTDAEISRYVQYAYEEIIGNEPWPFLMKRLTFTPVVGQGEYATSAIDDVNADLEAHRIARVMTRGKVLEYVTPDLYFERTPFGNTSTSQTSPQVWTVLESENLALWPPPDTTDQVQIVYAKLAAPLALDNDVPLMPSRYHQVLESGALVYVYQKVGDFEAAETKKKEFTDAVTAMREALLSAQPAEPIVYGGAEPIRRLARPLMPWEI